MATEKECKVHWLLWPHNWQQNRQSFSLDEARYFAAWDCPVPVCGECKEVFRKMLKEAINVETKR